LSAWDTLVSRLCSKNMSRALFYDKSGSVSGWLSWSESRVHLALTRCLSILVQNWRRVGHPCILLIGEHCFAMEMGILSKTEAPIPGQYWGPKKETYKEKISHSQPLTHEQHPVGDHSQKDVVTTVLLLLWFL
jgi:hypothetical protein